MSPPTPSSPEFFEATSRVPTTVMAPQNLEEDAIFQLQTPEQIKLLDQIDELRSQGLGHHGISLPQLIVCGDQSTGKSSVLEGLTRLRFPTKGVLCTTFATEVVLRRETDVKITCTIAPGKARSPADRRELMNFKKTYSSSKEFPFPSVLEEARKQMARGMKANEKTIFEDVLRVRYSGPDLPSLTIVDLPGMIKQALDGSDAAPRILDLVQSYMRNEKSIILAVVQAGPEPECQQVFEELMKYDQQYSRTLGIITKPDKVDQGSEEERKLIHLAKNESFPLLHRWHSVRNRASLAKDQSDAVRDETERQFFATGLWSSVPRADVGIDSLRTKLSRVLLQHVGMELPSIITAVDTAIASSNSSLKLLGNARDTSKKQREYLTSHAQEFHLLTNDALRGIYTNPFFALSSPDEQTPTRLRTAIQNLNIAFANNMYHKGHTWVITDEQPPKGQPSNLAGASYPTVQDFDTWFEEPTWIHRADFLENHIGGYVRQSRPSGLPSLVNPLVIGEVFRQQSRNWHKIAKHHLQQIFQAIKSYISEALRSTIDPRTCSLLMLKQIQPELDRRWRNVEEKLEELLVPYTKQEPMTYDPGFLRDLEDMRATRYRVKVGSNASSTHQHFTFGQNNTSKAFANSNRRLLTESLDDFTNSEILDLMQTYYKSAISVFISNVAVLAIENCLIKDLSAIFSPTLTASMEDDQLHAIAAESVEIRDERISLQERLRVLESGKQILYEHIAKAPMASAKKAFQQTSRGVKATRPRTPSPQASSHFKDELESTSQDAMANLTSKLNNLVVTPPPSGSNTRESSRRRTDSATKTPPKDGARRKRWPPQFDENPNAAVEDESDEEY